ncbi:MAG: hypothetical protein ABSC06_34225 [Rhodopila sp.]
MQAFLPVYGFSCIGGVGFFAAYLPELFPAAMRATGQGFCWNLAGTVGPLGSGVFRRTGGCSP